MKKRIHFVKLKNWKKSTEMQTLSVTVLSGMENIHPSSPAPQQVPNISIICPSNDITSALGSCDLDYHLAKSMVVYFLQDVDSNRGPTSKTNRNTMTF